MLQYKNRNEFKAPNETALVMIHFLRSFHEVHLISNTNRCIVKIQMSIHIEIYLLSHYKKFKK